MRTLGRLCWLLAVSLVSGCASGTAAPGVLSSPAGMPFPQAGTNSRYKFADPAPVVKLDPANPRDGNTVKASGTGVPAGQKVEYWLMPGFPFLDTSKGGLVLPGDAGGVRLGETTANATGEINFTFDFKPGVFEKHIVANGNYEIWLTYPPSNVVAPGLAWWQSPPNTSVSGKVFDGGGKPVAGGATVEVRVLTFNGVAFYDRTVPVIEGAYRLDDVPEPADTEITARVPNWPPRVRESLIGEIYAKWLGSPRTDSISGKDMFNSMGRPLIYNFGGPSTSDDRGAPGYFLAPAFLATESNSAVLTGRVYDEMGQLVPDSVGAKIIVNASVTTVTPPKPTYHVQVDVRAGTYTVSGVPTGVPVSVDLRTDPGYPLFGPRQVVLVPLGVLGHANVVNFGGAATPDDPDAPAHPFPSPQPPLIGL